MRQGVLAINLSAMADGQQSHNFGLSLRTINDSVIADAYDIQLLPMLVVTDRFLRVRQRRYTEPFYDVDHLRLLVNERLAAEPE